MKKGIAIQTILLLVVGIVVVGILVYFVYRYTTGTTISAYECRAKMISWCTGCYNTGGTGGDLPKEISDCLANTMGITLGESSTCSVAQPDCANFGVNY